MGADGGSANCGVLAYGAPHVRTVELYVKLYGSTDAGARAASRSRPLLNRGGSRPEAPPSMPSKTAERKTTELGSEKAMQSSQGDFQRTTGPLQKFQRLRTACASGSFSEGPR